MSPAADMVTLVDHALAYAAAGLEVFPLKADKTPYTEHGMKEATRDPAKIRSWWSRWPEALIGSRVAPEYVVLDLDARHGGVEAWQALCDSYATPDVGRWHASGRGDGGRHLWFRRPPGKLSIKRLNDWARDSNVGHQAGKRSWSAGIDLLHHGHRYTILPPSPHPDTGKPYTWGTEGEPCEMPGWLAHYVTADPVDVDKPALRLVGDADSIADWYSSAHSWHDLLPRDGWQLVEGDGDADGSKWRHPNASAAHSATVKHGCLFVYTPNTDFPVTEDGDPQGVTRFRAWALLEHDGDLKAAARGAYALRDGDPEESRAAFEAQFTKSPGVGAQPDEPADDAWPAPTPLDGVGELPRFPVHALPHWMAEHAVGVAEELQAPVDLPAMIGLAALATVAAKRTHVRVRSTWVEQVNLYLAVAMPPGSGKSPAYKLMRDPLLRWEAELRDQASRDISEAEQRRRMAEKAMKRAEDKGDAIEASRARLEFEMAVVPAMPKLFSDDATVESLVQHMAEQQGRLALMSTEGDVFDDMTGRYSDKAKLGPYLKAWSGDEIRVDRIGRGSSVVEEPALTIGLTVQPTHLARLAEFPELAGRGLTARFMYAMPEDNVGRRNLIDAPSLDPAARDRYDEALLGLARRLAMSTMPGTLTLAADALDRYLSWRQELEWRRRLTGDLRAMAEWTTKLESSVARVAGLLHIADGNGAHGTIGLDVVERAIAIGEYWLAHARAVHSLWSVDEVVVGARSVLEWLIRKGVAEVSIRDIHAGNRRRFAKAEDLKEPLLLLVEHGYVRAVDGTTAPSGRGGKASPRLRLNPCVMESTDVQGSARSVCSVPRDTSKSLSVCLEVPAKTRTPVHTARTVHTGHEAPVEAAPVDNPAAPALAPELEGWL